jgi:thiol peroxidase|tara:strand:- start:7215 stop:7592 length:378 start_codon:yes stop_codon:yes gene_type:complete
MGINLQRPIVKALGLEMINGSTRLLGIPKDKIQVVISLPDIKNFNEQLDDAISFFKNRAETFVITMSSIDECEEIIKEFELKDSLISREYKEFSKTFSVKDEENLLKKSLMIIDTNCQITHKEIL